MSHPERAAKFNEDADRTGWHDRSLWFVRQKRDRAVADVADWESLRKEAAAIKRNALGRLPELWERFEVAAQARGAQVHWARDAAEHNAIVLRLLRAHGAERVVKSKSMLTEECGLNPHLEAHGVEIVDTDLGERIVQLRGEPPSHIVMPAIHLRRREIGDLFARTMGSEPGCEDPEVLTSVARRQLRANFLAAQAGITGVNFAVAETGGVVVCTNEGNADLGTVIPRLHIACVGLEKIVPEVADLPVFLRLLARSATGQAITSYTSHFHGPQTPAHELHIVVVDNGRSELLGREGLREALSCIRCGACLNTCPVYRRSGGHSYQATVPGPIGSVLEAGRAPEDHDDLPHACTLCGSCTDVCPVRIPLHRQLLTLRAELRTRRPSPSDHVALWALAGWVMSHPRLYRLAGWLVRGTLRVLPAPWAAALGGPARTLPRAPRRSFRALMASRGDPHDTP